MLIIELLFEGKCYYLTNDPHAESIFKVFYGVLALVLVNLPFRRDHTVHPLPQWIGDS